MLRDSNILHIGFPFLWCGWSFFSFYLIFFFLFHISLKFQQNSIHVFTWYAPILFSLHRTKIGEQWTNLILKETLEDLWLLQDHSICQVYFLLAGELKLMSGKGLNKVFYLKYREQYASIVKTSNPTLLSANFKHLMNFWVSSLILHQLSCGVLFEHIQR